MKLLRLAVICVESVLQQQSAAAAAAPEPIRHVMPSAEGELVGRGRQKMAPPPATMEGIAGFRFFAPQSVVE